MGGEDRFVFLTEWFDSAASLIRPYNLIYYPEDNTIEMVTLFINYYIMLLIFYFFKHLIFNNVNILEVCQKNRNENYLLLSNNNIKIA